MSQAGILEEMVSEAIEGIDEDDIEERDCRSMPHRRAPCIIFVQPVCAIQSDSIVSEARTEFDETSAEVDKCVNVSSRFASAFLVSRISIGMRTRHVQRELVLPV